MTLPSLPVIDVYVAFNPTYSSTNILSANTQALPSSGSSNTYWTNCSAYLRSFSTNRGRQHYLDRVEASTLTMTMFNSTGFFFNGGSSPGNASGYVLQARMPIAVTATWSGTTYPVFWGLIDSITEQIIDQVTSNIVIQASDLLKQLSLKYMSSTNFWETYAASASVTNWYRCDTTNTAVVTAATGNGTTITYTSFNNFSSGQNVTVVGLGITSGATLNLNNVVIASASGSQFTVTNSTVGVSSGTGSAYRTAILDEIGSTNGNFLGSVAFPQYGAMVYDNDGCVDLTGGTASATQNSTGYIRLGTYSSKYGIDYWILGQNLASSLLAVNMTYNSGADSLYGAVTSKGFYEVVANNTAYTSSVQVNDGFWHHVGITANSSGNLLGYVDGTTFSIGAPAGPFAASVNLLIGAAGSAIVPGCAGQVDEIVISGGSSLSTLESEMKNRYIAGSLLQLPTNPSGTAVLSGDRIAQVLCIAGFGAITGGAIVLNSNTYFINNGSAWANGTSGNGYTTTQPYYWDTPVTTSTALDVIGQITDTDIGSFFQKPDGTLNFFNQDFYGLWTWTQSVSSLSVATGSKSLTVATGLTFTVGAGVVVTGVTSSMIGTVTSYNSGTGALVCSIATASGSGTFKSWNVGSWAPSYSNPSGDHVWTDDGSSNYPYEVDAQILRDDADLWTMVDITPQAGTIQSYENVAAEARFGFSVLTKTSTVHPTLNAALSTAYFLGYLFASPLPRVQSVQFQSDTEDGGTNTTIVGAAFGDPVTFKRTSPGASTSGTYPTVAGNIDANMVIEAIVLAFDAEKGQLTGTFTLDPYPLRS